MCKNFRQNKTYLESEGQTLNFKVELGNKNLSKQVGRDPTYPTPFRNVNFSYFDDMPTVARNILSE